MDRSVLQEVYRYWFGALAGPEDFPKDKSETWFKQSDATDAYICDAFAAAIAPAATAEWDLATLTREEQIALIVLLDQFPRNIFRISGEAFAYDARARAIAHALIEKGPQRFHFAERAFLYLPLEHSEDLADQDLSVFLFAELAVAAPEALKETARMYLDYATKHRDLIRMFGRFPHRNVMLGRDTTPEEAKFLEEHGRGY